MDEQVYSWSSGSSYRGWKLASLFKKKIVATDPETGQRTTTKSVKWWGRYRDEHGKDRRIPLFADKAAVQAKLNELVKKSSVVLLA